MTLDGFDFAILSALQRDASQTNAALAEVVNLSPSQCSRRRLALEAAGYIRGYRAELDAAKLGWSVEAFTRVTLSGHSPGGAEKIAEFFNALDEVQVAYTLTGDADYLIHVRVQSLEALARFVHDRLLPHPQVAQVRSDIVLERLGRRKGVPL